MAVAADLIPKLTQLKVEDSSQEETKMHRLMNLISFDNEITDEVRADAEKAGLKIYTLNEVI